MSNRMPTSRATRAARGVLVAALLVAGSAVAFPPTGGRPALARAASVSVDAEARADAHALRFSAVQGFEPVHFFLGSRATTGVRTVPESAANGFASWYDFGLAETAMPAPLPGRALCDTVAANVGDRGESSLSEGASPFADIGVRDGRFLAACTAAPSADASSTLAGVEAADAGLSVGTTDASSTTEVEPGGAVVARARAVLHDVELAGTIHLDTVRIEIAIRTDGHSVETDVDQAVTGAVIAGVPVTVDLDGVRIDEQVVPAPLRSEWDARWRESAEGPCECTVVPGRVEVDDADPARPSVTVLGPTLFHGPSGGITVGGAAATLVHRGKPASLSGVGTAGPGSPDISPASAATDPSPPPLPPAAATEGSPVTDAPGVVPAPAGARIVEEIETVTRRSRWPALAVALALAWILTEVGRRNRHHPVVRPVVAALTHLGRRYFRG